MKLNIYVKSLSSKGQDDLGFGLVKRFVKDNRTRGQYDITCASTMKAITR